MKPFALLLLPLLCQAAVPANELASVLDQARNAPPEFASDALIRIAALDTLEKAKRIELLADAFERASQAQQPLRRESAIVRVGAAANFLNRAYRLEMDGLSLRLRAVDAMLALDSHKAKELFLRIPPLAIPDVTCEEFLVYNVSRYYDVLGKIARQSFTAREIARNEPLLFLEQHLSSLKSPAQIAPAAQLIAEASLKDADFQALASAFAGSLGKVMGDDRSFTYFAAATGPAIAQVVSLLNKRKLNSVPLIDAYRLYLVSHLTAARCADDDLVGTGVNAFAIDGGRSGEAVGGEAAAYFNRELRLPPVQPLTETDATPSKVEGAATGLSVCRDSGCKAMASQFRELIFDNVGRALPLSAHDTLEWQHQLQQFLTALAGWKPSSDAGIDQYFREQCDYYNGLLAAIPSGPTRVQVLLAWLEFLHWSRTQVENRVEWFLPVSVMIARVTVDVGGLGKVREELQKSGDPVIALYLELERVAPRSAQQLISIM